MTIVQVRTNDAKVYELTLNQVNRSETLKNMIDGVDSTGLVIPLDNINSNVMDKIMDYNQFMDSNPTNEQKVVYRNSFSNYHFIQCSTACGTDCTKDTSITLHEIMLASDYLHLTELLDIVCEATANQLKGKNIDNMRLILNIPVKTPVAETTEVTATTVTDTAVTATAVTGATSTDAIMITEV
jgi:S-phase kinase-associated protein 1